MYNNDRRSARRFKTPDGGLRLHAERGRKTEHALIDFSYNSARFVAQKAFHPEQEVIFDLQTGDVDINELKGYVVRTEEAGEIQNRFFVVIKFFPFSTLDKYNSMENYQTLKSLITTMEKKGPDPRIH